MSTTHGVVIAAGVRTPQARQNGVLLNVTPIDLSGLVAREAVARSGIDVQRFGAVHWGLMYQTEGNSVHLAKQTAIASGLPPSVPAVLTSRLCCSGLQAVVDASRAICLGEIDVVLAGSVDCISRISALRLSTKRTLSSDCSHEDPVSASTLDEHSGKRMAELVNSFARHHEIERASLDDFAFQSRERARMAQESGLFQPEIVPIPPALLGAQPPQVRPFGHDQVESRWPTRASLARLESPYGTNGRVTRGNVSTFADGAAALILTNQAIVNRQGYQTLARIRSWAIAGAAADQIGDALVSAIEQALKKAGVDIREISRFEIEEAFAANCVYAARLLCVPLERINPTGGALGLGHPPATSGLRQLLCASHGMRRDKERLGLIAVSAGGSQAMAMVIENAG